MKGTYSPNLGPFGASPDTFMHWPVPYFSEYCAPLYGLPTQFDSRHVFYKPPVPPAVLILHSTTAYHAAPAAYSPEAPLLATPAGLPPCRHAHPAAQPTAAPRPPLPCSFRSAAVLVLLFISSPLLATVVLEPQLLGLQSVIFCFRLFGLRGSVEVNPCTGSPIELYRLQYGTAMCPVLVTLCALYCS